MAGLDLQRLGITNWMNLINNAIEYKNIKPNPDYTLYYDELERMGEW